jgi:transposase
MTKINFYNHSLVIALSEQRFFQRFIASQLHVPRSTIGGILARYKKDGHVKDSPQSGRPRLPSIRDKRLVVRMLNEPKLGNVVVVGRKLRAQGVHSRLRYSFWVSNGKRNF